MQQDAVANTSAANPSLIPSTSLPSHLSDSHTVASVRAFLSAAKPDTVSPIDVLNVLYFLIHKGEDHALFVSQQTLAQCAATDVRTVQRSLDRLDELGWITSTQRRGKSSLLSLAHDKLPSSDGDSVKVTPAAGNLAVQYQLLLKRQAKPRHRFGKSWLSQQKWSAQRILNACGGSEAQALALISHALAHPKLAGKARQSLYHLYGSWGRVVKSYSEVCSTRLESNEEPTHSEVSAEAIAAAEQVRSILGLRVSSGNVWRTTMQGILDRGHSIDAALGVIRKFAANAGGRLTLLKQPEGFADAFEQIVKGGIRA